MGIYTEAVQKLYVAYFSRPADFGGLAYWEKVVEAANGNTAGVSAAFAGSQEYKDTYAGKSSFQVINTIYNNLFGRDAEPAALLFWGNALDTRAVTVDNAVTTIAAAAQNADATAYKNKVAAATAFSAALDTTTEILGYDGAKANEAAKTWLSGVTTDASLTAATAPAALNASIAIIAQTGLSEDGQSFNLTAGVDTITGSSGNDTINAVIDLTTGATGNSFTALDSVDGMTGADTLNLNILNGGTAADTALTALPTITVANVETANIRSAVDLTADVSAWGASTVNVTQGKAVNLTAGANAAVNVSGTTGNVDINGGKSQTISVTGANVTSGTIGTAAQDTTGNVTIAVAQVADKDVVVTGGANVTVTTTGATTGNDITIGNGTQVATGTVKVSATGADYTATTAAGTMGTINVKGGTSIEVTQSAYGATAAAAADTTATLRTQGAVVIDGAGTATSVTVNQTKAVAAKNGVVAVAGVEQAATYTFGALLEGQTMTVGGLSFTAAKDLTAAEVAMAFANLSPEVVQGEGKVANGSYNGTFSDEWTSGAASGATVTFTAADASATPAAALAPTATGAGTLVQPTIGATVAGMDAVSGVTGVAGVANGSVTITDTGATDKIATVTLNGYATSSAITSDALTTLSVANSSGTLAVNNTVQKTLDLTVNALSAVSAGVGASVSASTYETVKLHVAGASTFGLTAAAAKSLTVDGTATANISGASGVASTLGALETVVVTGTAGLNMGNTASATLKSVDTTGTTGTVTASIDGTKATYTGGAGVDNVTLISSAAITKAVNLGAGDDTLTFVGTNVPTVDGKIEGGSGTNTLVLSAADAATLSNTASFEAAINNFQKVSIGAVAAGATSTVNLANLDEISYVISANGGNGTAEVQTFGITAGTGAAVAERQTFSVTGATGNGNVVVNGVNVAVTAAQTADDVGAAIVAAEAAIKAANANVASVTYAAGVVTVNYTTAAGNVAPIVVADNNGTTGVAFGVVAEAAQGDSNAGNITIGGATVALTAGMTADQVGAAIVAAKTAIVAGNPNISNIAYNSTSDVVTVTYTSTAGDVAPVVVTDTAATGATFGVVGTTTAGTAPVGGIALTVTNMANDGTLELTAAGSGATVTMTDATGTADTLNVKVTNSASINAGTIAAAGVETLKVQLDDTDTAAASISAVHTLTISDAALKSLVLTGDAGGIVTTNSNVLTSIDGSALTLSLTAGTLSTATVAATITGGAGDDMLTTRRAGDTLVGGAGDDMLVIGGAANGATLTGGAGADVFDISGVSVVATVNDYATITDFSAGDTLKLDATNLKFMAAGVTTGGTAVFQDLVNKFIAESNDGDAGWFVYQGNTYVVEHRSADAATGFVNGTDNIIKIVGTVDLSNNASFSNLENTLVIIGG